MESLLIFGTISNLWPAKCVLFGVHENPDLTTTLFIDFIYLLTFQYSIKKINTTFEYAHSYKLYILPNFSVWFKRILACPTFVFTRKAYLHIQICCTTLVIREGANVKCDVARLPQFDSQPKACVHDLTEHQQWSYLCVCSLICHKLINRLCTWLFVR